MIQAFKYTTYAIIFLLSLTLIYIIVSHKKTILTGTFNGITIGKSKNEVLDELILKSNVTAIESRLYEDIVINAENLADIATLKDFENIFVLGENTLVIIEMKNGSISSIENVGVGWNIEGDWKSFDEITPQISEFLRSDSEAIVFPKLSKTQNDSIVVIGHQAPPLSSEDFKVLMKSNRWFFRENNKYTFYNLYFSEDTLVKIEYRNDFIELP